MTTRLETDPGPTVPFAVDAREVALCVATWLVALGSAGGFWWLAARVSTAPVGASVGAPFGLTLHDCAGALVGALVLSVALQVRLVRRAAASRQLATRARQWAATAAAARAEAEAARQQFATLADAAPVTMQIKDTDLRIRWVNRAFMKHVGGEPADHLGKTVADLTSNAALVASVDAADREILDSGHTVTQIEQHFDAKPHRSARDMLVTKAPIRDAAGKITGILTIGTNVTALRRAQADNERMREEADGARRLLQDIVDNVPVAINIKDPTKRYVWTNRMFGTMTARPPGWAIGRTAVELTEDPALASIIDRDDDAVLATGRTIGPIEHENVFASGERQTVLYTKLPRRDAAGRVTAVMSFALDITAVKRAQAELAATHRLVDGILRNSPTAILVKDTALRVCEANDQACATMGVSRAELLGRRTSEVGSDLEMGRRGEAWDREVLATGAPVRSDGPSKFVRADGSVGQFLTTKAPIFDDGGAITHVVTYGTDVTELARANQARATQPGAIGPGVEPA